MKNSHLYWPRPALATGTIRKPARKIALPSTLTRKALQDVVAQMID